MNRFANALLTSMRFSIECDLVFSGLICIPSIGASGIAARFDTSFEELVISGGVLKKEAIDFCILLGLSRPEIDFLFVLVRSF